MEFNSMIARMLQRRIFSTLVAALTDGVQATPLVALCGELGKMQP